MNARKQRIGMENEQDNFLSEKGHLRKSYAFDQNNIEKQRPSPHFYVEAKMNSRLDPNDQGGALTTRI